MTSRRKLWLGAIVLYALFVSWYIDFGGPLTEAEIQAYIAKTENRDLGGNASAREALLEFLRNDTGGQFLMLNAIDLAKNPPPVEGAPPDADGQTLIDIIGNPEFYARHDFKLAGLEKTIAYPIEPRIYLGDLRLLLGLFMLAITALLDARLARKEPRADSQ